MDCPTCEAMVDAYVDGELTLNENSAFERALEKCPDCRRRFETARSLRGLLRKLPQEPAPDLLRARIDRELRIIAGRPPKRLHWMALAAGLLVALGIGWQGGRLTGSNARESEELVAAYVRVTAGEHPVDVASSDRHTVKPWFAGRIDYAPPVHDLTVDGYPLVGGRVDVMGDRKVAVLVYRRNQHHVTLVLWPAKANGNETASVTHRDGFALAHWRHGGFEMRATSDLSAADMAAFASAIDRAVDIDR